MKTYEPLISSGISEDFDSFIEYISFIKDISNDHGVSSNEELGQRLSSLAGAAKVIISDDVKMLDSAYKAEVVVIGDFSAGKSSFINSLIGKEVCPVNSAATTSSVTKFIFSFDERILNKTDGKTIDAQEYKKLVTHQGNTKATYELDYYYPFTPLRGVNLYDTPGFANATGQGDTQLTMKKAKEADAALLLVDINTGSVNDALKAKVSELQKANPDMLFYAVLNKADTKSPSARQKVKDEVMKNFDFFKGCYVYSCAPDAEGVDVETAKREIMDDLTQISKVKNKIEAIILNNDKVEFIDDFICVLNKTKHHLSILLQRKFVFNLEPKMLIMDFALDAEKNIELRKKKEGVGGILDYLTGTTSDLEDEEYEKAFSRLLSRIRNELEKNIDSGSDDHLVDELINDVSNSLKVLFNEIDDNDDISESELYLAVSNTITSCKNKLEELYYKDKQHYQNTIDKIDDFIAFIKQNEKNRKLNLKEKK